MRSILRARAVDPLSLVICMEVAWHYYFARDYTRAIEHAMSTLELEPAFTSAQHIVGLVYEQQGSLDKALSAFQKVHAGSGGNPATLASMGRILAASGRSAEARALLQQMDEIAARAYVPPYYAALIHASLGDADAALASLEDSRLQHDLWLVWLKSDPRFDVLHADPRFQELLRHIGLVTP